jgi:hypothetical protein
VIEVKHGIELIGQSRIEIMADQLGVWPVDNTDGPLLANAVVGAMKFPLLVLPTYPAGRARSI